jgi:hypothetical protein
MGQKTKGVICRRFREKKEGLLTVTLTKYLLLALLYKTIPYVGILDTA